MVIVGASMDFERKNEASIWHLHGGEDDHDDNVESISKPVVNNGTDPEFRKENEGNEGQEEHEEHYRITQSKKEAYKDLQHFSYYAFEGKTGALRWKHESNDFYEELKADDIEYNQWDYVTSTYAFT